jgi:outer membrane receptor protein involved in Fe transport
VFAALYALPPDGIAQQVNPATDLAEITVTATRRSQTLEEVPYSISVLTGQQLGQANITDIASLTEQVPGLSTYNYGARFVAATAPNIRGINATGTPRGFRTFEQDPVGTYIGNSPIDGYYQLDDIQRVEVLRGPQGTLYGAGALGGALRIIPNAPELNAFSGSIDAGGGKVAHSSDPSYSAGGVINVPVGETLAFRASGRYAYDAGFVDVFGLLKRNNSSLFGVPVLANPADPVNSSPIYSSKNDWNWQRTATGRVSILWKPAAAFSAELALLHSYVSGDGGPTVNFDYPGGVSPLDPHTTLPSGGHNQEFSQIDQPFSRNTNLTSLDLSYEVGFATLSATSSYHTTSAYTVSDQTYNITGQAGGFYLQYYAGVPANPRFVYDFGFGDSEHTFTQEVRLVSKQDATSLFDYVVGLFYEKQYRNGIWNVGNPGSPERSVAQGCTGFVFAGSAYPNCLLLSGVNDETFIQNDTQNFEDKSIFGELTWHFMPHGQITAGVRHFSQQFTDAQLYLDFTFPTLVPAAPHSSPASKTIGKINPSVEYAQDHFVYALWSQGFRRGGANSVPEAGIFAESPLLRYYQPDSTNNYEAGLKGRFANGFTYTLAVFDIRWDKPQISASLPSGNLAVYNAKTAESKGLEIVSSGPIGPPGWSYTFSFAYADAKLTSDYSLAANNGLGVITPGQIVGKAGTQLPGSPRDSVSATVSYARSLATNYDLLLSLNGSYHSLITFDFAPTPGFASEVRKSSSFEVMNFYATINHKPWSVTGYVTNLLDRQNVLVPPSQPNQVGDLTNDYIVSRPREMGLRLAYKF